MKTSIKELIYPLSFMGGIWGISFISNYLRGLLQYDILEFNSYVVIFMAFNIVLLPLSYFFIYYVLKHFGNKMLLWSVFCLCIFAFFFPYILGKTEIIYSLWTVFHLFVGFLYALALYFLYDRLQVIKRTKELEEQNEKSELALLKNQLNPHFLFNTLNNIDRLIKSNPDRASHSLLEMSDMMRYMIYETNTEKVSLNNELQYIRNYLDLQKLQYSNNYMVDFSVQGDTSTIKVAPMLFIPFIENAFKHTTDKSSRHPIRLSFEIKGTRIAFTAINVAERSKIISKDSSSGIGLETVRRRLEIIYPNKYTLAIDEKNDLFCVSLILDTND
ncbi:sensor histidine kinase [Bacteroidales bacterium OttesenSCG-928-M06]|nr:sensor histidine kinase [Bacteroidales bacterium OttesenSCG-928-M06]